MDNVFQNFLSYCHSNNIDLLKDDKVFIERLIRGVSLNYKRRLLWQYINEWQHGGRYAANTFLRMVTEGK